MPGAGSTAGWRLPEGTIRLGHSPPETLPGKFLSFCRETDVRDDFTVSHNKVGKLLEREVAEERLLNIPLS